MIVYHGTTLDIAKKIQAEGLRPHRETAFRLQREDRWNRIDDNPEEHRPYIYVTPDKKLAEYFAGFRARYERAEYGEEVPWSPFVKMTKYSHETNPDAIPAILEFNLPDDWETKFERDPQTHDDGKIHGFKKNGREIGYTAKICLCTIPPNFISRTIRAPRLLNQFPIPVGH